ncbi:MAG: N-acetyltransferase [Bacteroidia bacterium]|jgi:acetyltransferase-like isoleucine patch superfamily enzyme|nr:N-acetyltransferase [Bacteroidia bacterium]
MGKPFIHEKALVETDHIGDDTRVWAFVHILKGAKIGSNCNICDHCYIEYDVEVGNNVTIKCGIYLWEGVRLEDDVFLGPNVVFTNNPRPRSKQYIEHLKTYVHQGASIGANSTLLAGIHVGKYAMVGMASVVTRDVKDYALVYGNPARQHGWVDEAGNKLVEKEPKVWINDEGNLYDEGPNGLVPRKSIVNT